MAKRKISLTACWLLAILLWSCPLGWSETLNPKELEERLRRAEESYSEGNYSTAKEILTGLYQSFPTDPRSSYFQFMIAKCDYHLRNWTFADDKFKGFISQFPKSKFTPACYFMLGNIAYLQGAIFESAQNFVHAHQLAKTDKLKDLAERSLDPLLEKWLSEEELERLSRTNKAEELAPQIFFHLGKRNFQRGNFPEASEALSHYRDNFPGGEHIQEVHLLLREASYSPTESIKVGVLVPLTGDFSVYGSSLLNGVRLALSSHPSTQREVELEIGDTEGDFVRAALLCKELIEEDSVVCLIGPLRSESAAAAAVVANYQEIPLITPAASKEGLASLGDFVFQLSPSPWSKGKSLAEFAVKDQELEEFLILSPEGERAESEASAFKQVAQQLGAKILAAEHYPPGTQDFSPHLAGIKDVLLGFPSSSLQQEDSSLLDEIPVWAEGFFISADQREMYDILSHIANLNIYSTIIGTEGYGSPQVLEFTKNIGREAIFASDAFPQNDNALWESISDLYYDQYGKKPDRVSLLGYDSMLLLLSILERVVSPKNIKDALLGTADFKGASGGISFDAQGENSIIPIYKLEQGATKRVR